MVSGKQHSKTGKQNKHPVAPKKPKFKKPNKNQTKPAHKNNGAAPQPEAITPPQQLSFFINEYQSTNRIQLSSLELESIKGPVLLGSWVNFFWWFCTNWMVMICLILFGFASHELLLYLFSFPLNQVKFPSCLMFVLALTIFCEQRIRWLYLWRNKCLFATRFCIV